MSDSNLFTVYKFIFMGFFMILLNVLFVTILFIIIRQYEISSKNFNKLSKKVINSTITSSKQEEENEISI